MSGTQENWRWCRACMALFFGGAGGGVCLVTRGAHDMSQSMNYYLPSTFIPMSGQNNWRWCCKCHVLNYMAPGHHGDCAAGGKHDHTGSADYALVYEDAYVPPGAQREWHWCSKCQTLAYQGPAGPGGPGACPSGGAHDHSTSMRYGLLYK